jgi:hypothetical protein
VKSEPGKRVDVRDSTEDRVSMAIARPDPLITQLLGINLRVYQPVILYASAPVRDSSFRAKSTLRAMSLRISRWRIRNSFPSTNALCSVRVCSE